METILLSMDQGSWGKNTTATQMTFMLLIEKLKKVTQPILLNVKRSIWVQKGTQIVRPRWHFVLPAKEVIGGGQSPSLFTSIL